MTSNDSKEKAKKWAAERYGTKFTEPTALLYRDGAVEGFKLGYQAAQAEAEERVKRAHDWGYDRGQQTDRLGYHEVTPEESFAEFQASEQQNKDNDEER